MLLLYLDIDKLSICSTEDKILQMKNRYFEEYKTSNIVRSPNGKPLFEDSLLHIGVSDSGCIKIVALSEADFAIDLEYIRPKNYTNIAEYYFHQSEIDILRNSDNLAIDFFTIWTLKEAFIKLRGQTVFDIRHTPQFDIRNNLYTYQSRDYAFVSCLFEHDFILSIAYYKASENIQMISGERVFGHTLYKG